MCTQKKEVKPPFYKVVPDTVLHFRVRKKVYLYFYHTWPTSCWPMMSVTASK